MFNDDVESPGVGYSFKNIGKTHATIRETMPDNLVIAPDAPSATLTCLMEETFNVGGAVNFQKRKIAFWFMCAS